MINKIIRTLKQKHKTFSIKNQDKIFNTGDKVIVISGDHKYTISEIIGYKGNFCFINKLRENINEDKIKKRNKISNIYVKINQSNIMHLDPIFYTRSKVHYRYITESSAHTNKKNKIRIRVYNKSGLEQKINFTKKINIQQQEQHNTTQEKPMQDMIQEIDNITDSSEYKDKK